MKRKTELVKCISLAALMMVSAITFAQKEGPPPPPKKDRRAEHRDERKENIETMKIGFLTKRLDLTQGEAEKFWPVYNQYADRLEELRKKRMQDYKDAKQKFDELSDKEVEQAVDNEMTFRQKELDLQKEYHSKFKTVLPIKKVAKLYEAEELFKRELLNKLRDRKEPPPPPRERE